jgi:hypothetical protein
METPPESTKYPQYTSGKFWGGTVIPFWVMMLFTAFPLTGFFGLDHLLFRSPTTAFLKGLTNIFTFGLWYVYDMVQVFSDKQFIKDYGLSKPFAGAAGLGLDYFSGIKGKDTLGPSKSGIMSLILFVVYLFTIFAPFGVSNFVAGDVDGGIGKFLLSFGPWGLIWVPFLFVAAFFELYRNFTEPEKMFTEGAVRPTPLNFLMESTGYSPNIMNPDSIEASKEKQKVDWYGTFVKPVLSFFGITDPKEVLDTAKCVVVPPIKKTVNAATTAASGITALAATVPEVAAEASQKLATFTDPEQLKAAAAKASGVQVGGVQLGGASSSFDYLFIGGLGLLIVGGLFAAFLRKTLNKKNATEGDRDDRPTQPRLLRTTDGPR